MRIARPEDRERLGLPPLPLAVKVAKDLDRAFTPKASKVSTLDEFVGTIEPKKKRKLTAKKSKSFDLAREELAVALVEDPTLSGGKPRLLVALFAALHLQVYGAPCTEIEQENAYMPAVQGAQRLIDHEFGGDTAAAASFIRWAWRREQSRERKAAREGTPRATRLAWRWIFILRFVLDDYRVARARARPVSHAAG